MVRTRESFASYGLLAIGWWFPPGTPDSSTSKTDMTLAVAEALSPLCGNWAICLPLASIVSHYRNQGTQCKTLYNSTFFIQLTTYDWLVHAV